MDATPKSTSSKIDFWWRIEVVIWILFFIVIILSIILWQNYGFMTGMGNIYVFAILVLQYLFLFALIPKTIKCHHLGLRRKYVYGAIILILVLDTIRGVITLLFYY